MWNEENLRRAVQRAIWQMSGQCPLTQNYMAGYCMGPHSQPLERDFFTCAQRWQYCCWSRWLVADLHVYQLWWNGKYGPSERDILLRERRTDKPEGMKLVLEYGAPSIQHARWYMEAWKAEKFHNEEVPE